MAQAVCHMGVRAAVQGAHLQPARGEHTNLARDRVLADARLLGECLHVRLARMQDLLADVLALLLVALLHQRHDLLRPSDGVPTGRAVPDPSPERERGQRAVPVQPRVAFSSKPRVARVL